MAKLIILRGLPASGKSTWARSWCEDPANTWPHCVISLDDIRLHDRRLGTGPKPTAIRARQAIQ